MPDDNPIDAEPADEIAAKSPDERLKELQGQLKKDEDQLGTLTKERDALKTDVDSLAKTVDEITKARADYGKGLPALAEDKAKLVDYDTRKAPMIDVALGPKKGPVVEKIKEVKGAIDTKDAEVKKAREDAAKANGEAADAQADLDAKQAAYNDYKILQKSLGEKIQKANDYRVKIEKADDPPKAASMFVYLQELETVLAATNVPDQANFDKKLNELWQAFDDAKEVARKKKLAAEAANTKVATAVAELTVLRKNRVEDTLKKVEPFNV